MPVNGRDYTVLARLVAGVVPPQPGARAPLMFAANGVRPAQNNYLLDGIDNNTSNVDFLSGVAYIVKPPIDAVDEIKIMTSAFSAEYGRAGGAVLNTTLKSGSNQLRGAAWEFYSQRRDERQRLLRQQGGLKKGDYLSNQFGFTAGGPGHHQQDVLVRGLRGQPDQAGAHVGHDGADCGPSASVASPTISDLIALQTGTVGADVLGRTFPRGTVFDPATTRQVTCRTGRSGDRDGCHHDRLRARSVRQQHHSRRTGSTRTRLS